MQNVSINLHVFLKKGNNSKTKLNVKAEKKKNPRRTVVIWNVTTQIYFPVDVNNKALL